MRTSQRLALLLAMLPFIGVAVAGAAPAKTPLEYVDEALAVAKSKSFHTREVDWSALTDREHKAAESATDILDTYPILVDILIQLGDGHSFIQVSPERRAAFKARYGYEFNRAFAARKKPTSSFSGRADIKTLRTEADGAAIQVFNVPQFSGGGAPANAYARRLFDAQAEGAPWACGYVVDLRGNGGGNVWPMLAGLEPLLGEGRVSGHRDLVGVHWIELRGGAAQLVDQGSAPKTIAQTPRWTKLLGLDQRPVAVLIDDATASSGEGVAVAFRTRENTRFFGDHTYGISTSNEGFTLSDGANLVITTGVMVDRLGTDQAKGIAPDEAIDPHLAADGSDPALARAAAWVAEHRSCPAV